MLVIQALNGYWGLLEDLDDDIAHLLVNMWK